MQIIPAIDLKDGLCVRLRKGEFDTVHKVADDAVETAQRFEEDGAEILHMVDLDGALRGDGKNLIAVSDVIKKTDLKVELGGGLRCMDDLDRVSNMGVWRMVIGSAAVDDPAFVESAVRKYGERIAVGVDSKGGKVRISGWTSNTGLDHLLFTRDMEKLGVKTIIFTDIERDGMLTGPPLKELAELKDTVLCDIIASGGVASLSDISLLSGLSLAGVIVGKAIYTGDISLKEAVELCR